MCGKSVMHWFSNVSFAMRIIRSLEAIVILLSIFVPVVVEELRLTKIKTDCRRNQQQQQQKQKHVGMYKLKHCVTKASTVVDRSRSIIPLSLTEAKRVGVFSSICMHFLSVFSGRQLLLLFSELSMSYTAKPELECMTGRLLSPAPHSMANAVTQPAPSARIPQPSRVQVNK